MSLHQEVTSELGLARGEDALEREEVVAVITFPLQHFLAQLVILVAGLVAVDVNQSPLAVRDEIMVLVQDIPQLPQDQLEGLRLEIRAAIAQSVLTIC